MKLYEALRTLKNEGYDIDDRKNLVDIIKAKIDEYESKRNTPDGDDMWDILVEEYGNELVNFVAENYNEIKSGDILDMTGYFRDADGIYPEFIQLMKQVGAKKFMFDTRVAFKGKAGNLFQALTDTKVNFDPYKYIDEVPNVNYAVLELDKYI